jgi:hypothetical protein
MVELVVGRLSSRSPTDSLDQEIPVAGTLLDEGSDFGTGLRVVLLRVTAGAEHRLVSRRLRVPLEHLALGDAILEVSARTRRR